jgi:flagellar biosynthetic protein FliQ
MGLDGLVDMVREAMFVTLTLMSPLLILGLAVGLMMGVFQTITNIHDPTISLIPRMIALLLALLIGLPWLASRMLEYSHMVFSHARFIGGS